MENEIDLDFEETYEATDLTGTGPLTKLSNEEHQQFIGQYTKQIDLSKHAKGIYFLEIETDKGVINKKLILQ